MGNKKKKVGKAETVGKKNKNIKKERKKYRNQKGKKREGSPKLNLSNIF